MHFLNWSNNQWDSNSFFVEDGFCESSFIAQHLSVVGPEDDYCVVKNSAFPKDIQDSPEPGINMTDFGIVESTNLGVQLFGDLK